MLDETYVEEQIAASGVGIFHPEDHSFAEQLRYYTEAKIVVFHEGSACLGTELLGAAMMGRVGLIDRRPEVGVAFNMVLGPRSKFYMPFFETTVLGSVVVTRDGGLPQLHLGVAVAAPTPIMGYLRGAFALALDGFSPDEFLRRSRQDLHRYCDFHRANGTIASDHELDAFLQNANSVLDDVARREDL